MLRPFLVPSFNNRPWLKSLLLKRLPHRLHFLSPPPVLTLKIANHRHHHMRVWIQNQPRTSARRATIMRINLLPAR